MTQSTSNTARADDRDDAGDPRAITRPDPALMTYYLIVSALTLIAFPFVLIPLWLKYRTLRYRFDDEGVSMAWGMLVRKEILLTYRRIQDIHVKRGIIQRRLGLADLAVQTASGSAGAEMTIVGVRHPERLRDFLYSQMRGARADEQPDNQRENAVTADDEALRLLVEIRDLLRAKRKDGGTP